MRWHPLRKGKRWPSQPRAPTQAFRWFPIDPSNPVSSSSSSYICSSYMGVFPKGQNDTRYFNIQQKTSVTAGAMPISFSPYRVRWWSKTNWRSSRKTVHQHPDRDLISRLRMQVFISGILWESSEPPEKWVVLQRLLSRANAREDSPLLSRLRSLEWDFYWFSLRPE